MGPTLKKRVWKLKAPACGLTDAPAAFHRSLKRHRLNADLSVKNAGLRCQAPTFDPRLFLVFRDQGRAVGAFATHIDDISGCSEPDVLPKKSGVSGTTFWYNEAAGALVCACGHGIDAGCQFFGDPDSRGLYQGSPTFGYVASIMGGASEIALAGRYGAAPMQIGRTLLAGNCFATGYLR